MGCSFLCNQPFIQNITLLLSYYNSKIYYFGLLKRASYLHL